MRQIPMVQGPGAPSQAPQQPYPPKQDMPGHVLSDAYTQGGMSSVVDIPGMQNDVPSPRTAFDQYGNIVPMRVGTPMITVNEDSIGLQQDVHVQSDMPVQAFVGPVDSDPRYGNPVQQTYPQAADFGQPPPPQPSMTSNERTAMMDDGRRVFSSDRQAAWMPICRGTIDQVLMSADGAHILVLSDGGSRFAAFIPNRPVIELGIMVELGIRHSEDTGRRESRDVADIILMG